MAMQIFRRRTRVIPALGVAICILVLVGACSSDKLDGVERARGEPPQGPRQHEAMPVRGNPGPLAYIMDEDSFPCSTCHEGFDGELTNEALENTHSNITFDHGRNVRCSNCHHPTNADVYVDHDGSEIPSDEPTLLCAKCHGPHYREWTLDVHGRVNKFWDKRFGEQGKLACNQCHDPHQPRFQLMVPESPPVLTRFDLGQEEGARHE